MLLLTTSSTWTFNGQKISGNVGTLIAQHATNTQQTRGYQSGLAPNSWPYNLKTSNIGSSKNSQSLSGMIYSTTLLNTAKSDSHLAQPLAHQLSSELQLTPKVVTLQMKSFKLQLKWESTYPLTYYAQADAFVIQILMIRVIISSSAELAQNGNSATPL